MPSPQGEEYTSTSPISNHDGSRRTSDFHVPTMEQIDPNEPAARRPSVYRRESFLVQFAKTKGPPQITLLMMLVAIGLGSTIGVVPAVMSDRFARLRHGYDGEELCSDILDISMRPAPCMLGSSDAQNAAAAASLVSNVLTFITSSLMGSLSDEHGRRGMLSSCPARPGDLMPTMSPWWYYGLHMTTGFVNWVAVALSSLADVLPPRFRAPGIGIFLAGFMLGFSLAPMFSIFLNHVQLSFTSFLVAFSGLICTIVFIPETLPPEVAAEAQRRRREMYHRDEATVAVMLHLTRLERLKLKANMAFQLMVIRPIRELSILNRNRFFRLISLLAFFSGMVTSGDQLLLVYYVEEQLGFTDKDVSLMFVMIGIMGLMAQGILLKPLNECIGEKMVVAFCFLIGAIDNIMYGLANKKSTIYAAVALGGLAGMAFPTISAIKSNNVDVSEQGRIQGALYSLQALASGVGPVLLRYVYSHTKNCPLGAGTMFVFAGLLYLVAVAAACALPKELANSRHDDDDDDDSEEFESLYHEVGNSTGINNNNNNNNNFQTERSDATDSADSYGSF
eukprot:scaffold3821_cov127-Cylindrotheca_fusiformis.AAC.7